MAANTIDRAALSRLVEAGVVREVHVVGESGGFAVSIKRGTVEQLLVAQRNRQIRRFKRMETLITFLKSVGICRFDVDVASYIDEPA